MLDNVAIGSKRKKTKQLLGLKIGQVETCEWGSSGTPDGAGVGGGLLPRVFLWFSRVGPAACSPNESHVRPAEKVQSSNQMCTSSGVTFSSVCDVFPFCLSHSQYSLSSTSFCLPVNATRPKTCTPDVVTAVIGERNEQFSIVSCLLSFTCSSLNPPWGKEPYP